MKVFNFDIEKDLWHRMEIQATVRGITIKAYVEEALATAIINENFTPHHSYAEGEIVRKNVPVPKDLWAKVCVAAARADVSKREYLNAAIAAAVTETISYPVSDEVIIVDTTGLGPNAKKYLLGATGGKLAPAELINRFAEGLALKDKRLMDWLQDQVH